MIRFAIIATCVLGTPVLAQEGMFDTQILTDCIAAQDNPGMAQLCIGGGLEICMNNAGDRITTMMMNDCATAELSYWDAMLNTEYGRLMSEAAAPVADRLQAMQRAWIDYRDAACAFEASVFEGGSLATTMRLDCLMQLTGEQALVLRHTEVAF